MKIKSIIQATFACTILSGCGSGPSNVNVSVTNPSPARSVAAVSPTMVPTSVTPKNGDYNGKGVVTKINLDQGSVELNHEEIKDMMPAMQMEFFVSDKNILDGLKVGDKVDFVLRYKHPTETIVGIKKVQ